jgi:hypothetical protein
MSAIVLETVEVRAMTGADFPPSPSSTGAPRLALAWHVHQSVLPLHPRVLDRLPPADGGLVCATVHTLGQPAGAAAVTATAAVAAHAAWEQQWWQGPAASTPRTVYLQTSAV